MGTAVKRGKPRQTDPGVATEVNEPSNGAAEDIATQEPYTAQFTLEGTSDMLFHAWNCQAIDAKAAAAKGSKAKKTDNVESYVWRDDDDHICLPGEYVRQSIITAAKSNQDPRSPRKSAMDLFKAALLAETMLAPITSVGRKQFAKEWDYEDTRRVVVQRAGVNRTRPAFKKGWKATFTFTILTPEYVPPVLLHEVLVNAGRLVGTADFRPSYGRFQVTAWEVITEPLHANR